MPVVGWALERLARETDVVAQIGRRELRLLIQIQNEHLIQSQ
jgi:hypothetical protein